VVSLCSLFYIVRSIRVPPYLAGMRYDVHLVATGNSDPYRYRIDGIYKLHLRNSRTKMQGFQSVVFQPSSQCTHVIFFRFISEAFKVRSFSERNKKGKLSKWKWRIPKALGHHLAEKTKKSAARRGTGEYQGANRDAPRHKLSESRTRTQGGDGAGCRKNEESAERKTALLGKRFDAVP
jgi:hypothetical protein